MKHVHIYTDGACSGNPGPGGWAALLVHRGRRKELSGAERLTTNNRMELAAAIEGIRALKEPCLVTITTDSEYLRQGITSWLTGWKRRGWKTTDKKPVKNRELWETLDALSEKHKITWEWVKGHAEHPENERCDDLAVAAMKALSEGTRNLRR